MYCWWIIYSKFWTVFNLNEVENVRQTWMWTEKELIGQKIWELDEAQTQTISKVHIQKISVYQKPHDVTSPEYNIKICELNNDSNLKYIENLSLNFSIIKVKSSILPHIKSTFNSPNSFVILHCTTNISFNQFRNQKLLFHLFLCAKCNKLWNVCSS